MDDSQQERPAAPDQPRRCDANPLKTSLIALAASAIVVGTSLMLLRM